jgi:guanylate kinase
MILVLSSPSGGGKSTIAARLVVERADCGYSVSATTRNPRPGEVAGEAYHFLTEAEFDERVRVGDFAEHAVYNGHQYGTLSSELVRVLHGGRHAILDIEVHGARQVRARFPEAVLVFIVPPSGAELARRLKARGTERPAVVTGRLQQAIDELGAAAAYDYIVVNDELEQAVQAVGAILDAESCRTTRQRDVAVVLDRLRTEVAAEVLRAAEAR